MVRIIAVANQKGGCGKTTAAINLSAALSAKKKRVLLVDLDPQAHAGLGLGVEVEDVGETVFYCLIQRASIEGIIKRVGKGCFDLAPSNILLSGADLDLADAIGRENLLKNCLEGVAKRYDFIVLDCPPSLGLLTINALVAAKEVLVPVQTHYFALGGMRQLLDTIDLVRKRLNTQLRISGILASLHDPKARISKNILASLRGRFGAKLLDIAIRMDNLIAEAQGQGKPVTEYSPGTKGSRDFQRLAQEIIKLEKNGVGAGND